MSTGYYITIGYNSSKSRNEAEAALLQAVEEICATPEKILIEAHRVEGVQVPQEYADNYRHPWSDLTIKVFKAEDGLNVMQMASGGGVERDYKETMRRAFCRLLIAAMHRQKCEVNLCVV